MSHKIELEESLSALMDNEVDDLELRRVLKALPESSDLHAKWSNFHLISAVVNQETHVQTSVGLLSGIQDQLENESIPVLEKRSSFLSSNFFKTASQSAIAASVALIVLFTANTFNTNTSSSAGVMEVAEVSNSTQTEFSTPEFNGEYTVSEFSRMASYDSKGSSVDDSKIEHLRQAVYKEFKDPNENVVDLIKYTPSNE